MNPENVFEPVGITSDPTHVFRCPFCGAEVPHVEMRMGGRTFFRRDVEACGCDGERRWLAEVDAMVAEADDRRRDDRRAMLETRWAEAGIPLRYRGLYSDDHGMTGRLRDGVSVCIHGDTGTGKTEAASRLATSWMDDDRALFVTEPDYLAAMRASYERGGELAESRVYRDVPLLVIDDLGKTRPTDWTVQHLWSLLNARYNAGLPTVVTTQYETIPLGERMATANVETARAIASRMLDWEHVRLTGGDHRRTR